MSLGIKHFFYRFLVGFISISTYYLKSSYYIYILTDLIRRLSRVFISSSRLYTQGNTTVSLDAALAYSHFYSYYLRQILENTGSARIIRFFPISKPELHFVCQR